MFFPGETIIHKFTLPFEANEIDQVVISYKQDDDVIFEKTITSGFESEETNTIVSFAFTQQEGLLFADNANYSIQCNVFTKGGSRHTSRPIRQFSGSQHLREVMRHVE